MKSSPDLDHSDVRPTHMSGKHIWFWHVSRSSHIFSKIGTGETKTLKRMQLLARKIMTVVISNFWKIIMDSLLKKNCFSPLLCDKQNNLDAYNLNVQISLFRSPHNCRVYFFHLWNKMIKALKSNPPNCFPQHLSHLFLLSVVLCLNIIQCSSH